MSDLTSLIRQLKNVAGKHGPALGLCIPGFDSYFLRPVTSHSNLLDLDDVKCLTVWRNRHVHSFLTEFESTDEQTAKWLTQIVHPDDTRILFIIEDLSSKPVGCMGIANIDWKKSFVEADAIISDGSTPRGLMSVALRTVLRWARGQLGLRNISVRVLSDNPALIFYKKVGFVEVKRVPLRSTQKLGITSWVEDLSIVEAERYLVHHIWNDDEN